MHRSPLYRIEKGVLEAARSEFSTEVLRVTGPAWELSARALAAWIFGAYSAEVETYLTEVGAYC